MRHFTHWRKMTTAPEDTPVFLVMANNSVTVGWWAKDEGEIVDYEKGTKTGAWIDGTVGGLGVCRSTPRLSQ